MRRRGECLVWLSLGGLALFLVQCDGGYYAVGADSGEPVLLGPDELEAPGGRTSGGLAIDLGSAVEIEMGKYRLPSVTVNGDSPPDDCSYVWSKVSGPDAVLSSWTVAQPEFEPSIPDTYVFELTVTDPSGRSGSGEIRITVLGDPFEYDNGSLFSTPVPFEGPVQTHTLHRPGDVDWLKFTVPDRIPHQEYPLLTLYDVSVDLHCEFYLVQPVVPIHERVVRAGEVFDYSLILLEAGVNVWVCVWMDEPSEGQEGWYRAKFGSRPIDDQVATPTFTPGEQVFDEPFEVTISCDTEDATIVITTNGTQPSRTRGQSVRDGHRLEIRDETTLKALAFHPDYADSELAMAWYRPGYRLTVHDGTGSGVYLPDAEVTVEALSPDGQAFNRWMGDIEGVDDPYSPTITVRMDSPKELTALFGELELEPAPVLTPPGGSWITESESAPGGTRVTAQPPTITIEPIADTTVYYTQAPFCDDPQIPSPENGIEYTEPFELGAYDAVVQAVGYRQGVPVTEVATARFYSLWFRDTSFTLYLDCGVQMTFGCVGSADFQMGSPESEAGHEDREAPVHTVEIRDWFYIGMLEVTQAQWRTVMGDNPSHNPADDHPVEQVSWDDAQAFCQRLSEMTGRSVRLPTEAEWEYALRGYTTGPFNFGLAGDYSSLEEGVWHSGNSGGHSHRCQSARSTSFWRMYDMRGNVSEWCEDVYHEDYIGAPTSSRAWLTGGRSGYRVIRGGSFATDPVTMRSAARGFQRQDEPSNDTGFRVVVDVEDLPVPDRVDKPSMNPQGKYFTDTVEVELTCPTPHAHVLYIPEGTYSSMYYPSSGLRLKKSTDLVAYGWMNGMLASEPVRGVFTKPEEQCEPVEIDDEFDDGVFLTCPTEGARIYYTLFEDWDEWRNPATDGRRYNGPIMVTESCWIEAVAMKDGLADSEHVSIWLARGSSSTPVCGNGDCESGESCHTCPEDCGACPSVCGNGDCESGESCQNCPADCGECSPVCGNGNCESGENSDNCPEDCPAQNFGEVTSPTRQIEIFAWDNGLQEDGDRVAILLNGSTVVSNLTLTFAGQSVDITLAHGRNEIDILALNEGDVPPNTAAFDVYDNDGNLLTTRGWGLQDGEFGRLIVVYSP